jgi:predicted nuclease with RNAse H fold
VIAVGVDVGVHALDVVRLADANLLEHRRVAPDAFGALLAEWQADIVGVDAPSGWATAGSARASEIALIGAGIRCFRTPMRGAAGSSFYDWVRGGHDVFACCIGAGYALGRDVPVPARSVIEVFPHAATLALLGGPYTTRRAADKRAARRAALARAGIDIDARASLDAIDASLCAWTAREALAGRAVAYGDRDEGPVFVAHPVGTLVAGAATGRTS